MTLFDVTTDVGLLVVSDRAAEREQEHFRVEMLRRQVHRPGAMPSSRAETRTRTSLD